MTNVFCNFSGKCTISMIKCFTGLLVQNNVNDFKAIYTKISRYNFVFYKKKNK